MCFDLFSPRVTAKHVYPDQPTKHFLKNASALLCFSACRVAVLPPSEGRGAPPAEDGADDGRRRGEAYTVARDGDARAGGEPPPQRLLQWLRVLHPDRARGGGREQ